MPLNWKGMPPYTTLVLQKLLLLIPFGKTISYQGLAELTGNPRAARAVGNACGSNPFTLVVPCHRVLAAGDRLGGYSLDESVKRRLLAFEGVTYKE